MAKQHFKYILNPGVSGDIHVKAPEGRKEGGKYVLDKAKLSQADLEHLYEKEGMTNIITRVEIPADKAAAVKKKEEESTGKKNDKAK